MLNDDFKQKLLNAFNVNAFLPITILFLYAYLLGHFAVR